MSSYQSPQENPTAWHTVLIQGEPTPGYATVEFKVARKIDEKPSPGSETFSLTDKGATCTDVTITLKIWTPEHFAAYQRLYEKYFDPRRPLNKRNVVTIVHPETHARGIRQLYFCEAEAAKLADGGIKPTELKVVGKEYNAKTRLGGGSSKPKPATFNAGALSNANLNKGTAAASGNTAAGTAAAPAAPKDPPKAQTSAEQRAAAAKGDPRAKFVVSRVDARAAAAGG